MTDQDIINVVAAHQEGKIIECRNKGCQGWSAFSEGDEIVWNFGIFDFRIAPEPRKPRELFLTYSGNGLWWETLDRSGTLFREVIE